MRGEAYKAAGVDRDAAARAKKLIARHARTTFTSGVVGDIGFFGSLFQVKGFQDPVLVSHTDGVGTKLKIAHWMDSYETVGMDVVNHCINDIFTCAARPLFFLDYIGTGKVVPERVERLAAGMAQACREAGCALIGGETAELPGLYQGDDFDLVGFVVGAVERNKIIDGSAIQEGDVLLGIPSSGLHTNGYSLVRRVFHLDTDQRPLRKHYADLGCTLGEALIAPHRCYYPLLEPALPYIKGMAHITGGGFLENVPRILPKGLSARFHTGAWEVPPIFRLIQQAGDVGEREMFRVFNMGIGMVVACEPGKETTGQAQVPEARVIGEIIATGDQDSVILV
ncbi:MAG: phosphoribosylformylglycinamidine cyclo-ligase [Chloroflexi bacterium]|nr:phosphoribosylformylglycinamidine cyclo-ligase [Chloroflexota bacterium]